ncbi:hypothetical protein [Amycolatopsis dendrobii]|uniref:Uncharacterized protein n=1 Tax=Amycolatopsis dendrobii TaxID=2760662 RepID=A0A7W3ZAA5_9PSEU|nr:hypothetical protein [Amycolatopsis dendrobii]MBB1154005.1 hypothetical protein [Amycolatopsis dendrobii]
MTSNASGTGAWTLQQRNNARQGRALAQSLFLGASQNAPLSANRSGVLSTASDGTQAYDFRVTVASGLTMTVQPGSAIVNRAGQGPYPAWRVPAAVNVTCDPAPATNPRNDLVVLRVYDAALGDVVPAEGPVAIQVITGSPGPTPVDPVTADATGTVTNWATAPVGSQAAGGGVGIILARAQVSTGGVITLTDLRRSTGLIGGVRVLLPGDSLTDPSYMPGDIAWFNGHRYWDGTAWQELSSSLGYAKGLIAKTVYNSEGVFDTQTETVGDGASFTFDPARSYQFDWQGTISATADRPYMSIGWRIANGGTVTNTSPLMYSTLLPIQGNGKFDKAHLTCPISGAAIAALGISAGTVRAAITHYITAGNGGSGWQVRGDNGVSPALPNKRHFAVFDTGLSR